MGIGLLGARAIILQGTDIRGLTTAASLWAAIGTAVGAGFIFGAVATTVVVVAALYLLHEVHNLVLARFRTEFGVLTIAFSDTGASIGDRDARAPRRRAGECDGATRGRVAR
jgi:putative Mg2+ transporter-C (MgtC) family protein